MCKCILMLSDSLLGQALQGSPSGFMFGHTLFSLVPSGTVSGAQVWTKGLGMFRFFRAGLNFCSSFPVDDLPFDGIYLLKHNYSPLSGVSNGDLQVAVQNTFLWYFTHWEICVFGKIWVSAYCCHCMSLVFPDNSGKSSFTIVHYY